MAFGTKMGALLFVKGDKILGVDGDTPLYSFSSNTWKIGCILECSGKSS